MSEALDAHYAAIVTAWIAVALVAFLFLLLRPAPYGRHARSVGGPTLPARAGWLLMELPALVVLPGLFLLGDRRGPVALAFCALWLLHYAQRVLVYPLRFRGAGRPVPLTIAASAFGFNLVNGWINGRWLFTLAPPYPRDWLADPRFLAGAALFAAGFAANLHSDSILLALRRPGETGYRVPHGGLYRFVSCPNYLSEIVEWCGWALLTWSLAGVSFALWTVANLLPRALSHHRWYRATFPDYPPGRRAVVPFLL